MTSICGFIRKFEVAYGMYYAVLHDNRQADFVRLSLSMGAGWRTGDYGNRRALCIDFKPERERLMLSVQDADASPQREFPPFGKWLDRNEARVHHALEEFLEIANFIMERDPAVRSYLAGEKIDFAGRNAGNGEHG
jgi:hypothetical protein